jgi:hypothetical protein
MQPGHVSKVNIHHGHPPNQQRPRYHKHGTGHTTYVATAGGRSTAGCSRFKRLAATTLKNRVPDDFEVNRFIASGGLEIPLPLEPTGDPAADLPGHDQAGFLRTQVRFRVFRIHSDNLLQDLNDHPLSDRQKIEHEVAGDTGPAGETTVVVTIPDMLISRSLVDWMVGRLDRLEVLEPHCLRDYLISRLEAMLGRYAA